MDVWVRVAKKFGKAKKTDRPSYVMDISHDGPRISTSSKKLSGHEKFLLKHKEHMSGWQIKAFKYSTAVGTGSLKFQDLIFYFSPKVFPLQVYLYVRQKVWWH